MMHDAWGGLGMSAYMWLLIVLPVVALAVAIFALLRRQRALSTAAAPAPIASAAVERPDVALDASHRRLLDEDEQRLYDLVVARSGDVAQGDLVALSGFSKAKVSRVVDRLEQKGLVVRLRRGMGNRVVVPPMKQP